MCGWLTSSLDDAMKVNLTFDGVSLERELRGCLLFTGHDMDMRAE